MRILVDLDDVLNDFTFEWALLLDELYGTGIGYEDIKAWELTETYTSLTHEQIFSPVLEDSFYHRLRPVKDASEVLQRLIADGHSVFIVTNTDYRVVSMKMREFLFKYYPFIKWENVILTSHKQLIRGDILIDDCPGNLQGGEYIRLLFDAPYNRSLDAQAHGMTRVHEWEEIYGIISSLNI